MHMLMELDITFESEFARLGKVGSLRLAGNIHPGKTLNLVLVLNDVYFGIVLIVCKIN